MINQLSIGRTRSNILKYSAITLTNLQNQFVYIWDALNRATFILIIMFIFIQLWTVVYEARGASKIAGLTLANTIWYFLMAEVMELSRARHDQAISEEVKSGIIAYTLIRPYNYLAYHFFNGLGEVVVKMVLIFLFGLPLVLFYAGAPQVSIRHLPAILLVMALAIIIDFMIYSMIGLLAFVTEDVSSFRLIYQKFVFILGGLMIPLDFLPSWLGRSARLLPFNLTTYAPAKLFAAFDSTEFWQTIALQLFWISVIALALRLQYGWATRNLEINGG